MCWWEPSKPVADLSLFNVALGQGKGTVDMTSASFSGPSVRFTCASHGRRCLSSYSKLHFL
jgi:hypothetical protein